jgi:pimeloyl-ACP methyl ester carboxylesterase
MGANDLMDGEPWPEGDGHPVIIVPGRLDADRRAMLPLRNCCEKMGYAVYDWQQGFNGAMGGDVDAWLHNLAGHVQGVFSLHARRVTLIGWRLGGLYAREIARVRSHLVRQVVSMGTPVDERLAVPIPVPTLSICSRVGMPWHPRVLRIVAERLLRPEGALPLPDEDFTKTREARFAGNQPPRHLSADRQPGAYGHQS